MISVVAITGETYDLNTGRETPKGVILSNGVRNITIEVSDEVIKEVILLDAEVRNAEAPKRNGKTRKVKSEPMAPPVALTDEADENPLGEAVEPPPEDDPGFDYADADTGVSSV